MKTYVIIENGIVINRTQAESPLEENWVESDRAQIGWTYVDGVFAPPAVNVPTVAEQVPVILRQIDGDVDAIYAAAVGNRATEYQKSEEQARSYRAADYAGDGPKAVTAWANATGNSARWAADDIIATADAWHTAEDTIRDVRLMCKQRARNAQTEEALEAVRIQWAAFLAQIRAQLG